MRFSLFLAVSGPLMVLEVEVEVEGVSGWGVPPPPPRSVWRTQQKLKVSLICER